MICRGLEPKTRKDFAFRTSAKIYVTVHPLNYQFIQAFGAKGCKIIVSRKMLKLFRQRRGCGAVKQINMQQSVRE